MFISTTYNLKVFFVPVNTLEAAISIVMNSIKLFLFFFKKGIKMVPILLSALMVRYQSFGNCTIQVVNWGQDHYFYVSRVILSLLIQISFELERHGRASLLDIDPVNCVKLGLRGNRWTPSWEKLLKFYDGECERQYQDEDATTATESCVYCGLALYIERGHIFAKTIESANEVAHSTLSTLGQILRYSLGNLNLWLLWLSHSV